MIPVSATGSLLGNGLRPLSHHPLFGGLHPQFLPPLPISTQSYLVESLLRERGYSIPRPVPTKPNHSPTNLMGGVVGGVGGMLRSKDEEEVARHYLGLFGRPPPSATQNPPSPSHVRHLGTTPSPTPRTGQVRLGLQAFLARYQLDELIMIKAYLKNNRCNWFYYDPTNFLQVISYRQINSSLCSNDI